MKRSAAVLLVCAGCLTKQLWRAPAPPPVLVAETQVEARVTRDGDAIAVDLPERRLRLERPRGFGFAAYDTVFGAVGAISVTYAEQNGVQRELALLRVTHAFPEAGVAPWTDPAPAGRRLDAIDDRDTRVLLGRGLDRLAGDRCVWLAALDEAGADADVAARLDAARAARSLAPLAGVRVVGRANGALVHAPLDRVVRAAQAVRDEDGNWTWESLWSARWTSKDALAVSGTGATVLHREYEEGRRGGNAWRALLTPIALAGDLAAAAIDDELSNDETDLGRARKDAARHREENDARARKRRGY